jgi:hypothetical protein
MKAAVLHELGGVPRYEDFPNPVAGDGEVVITVKAVAVENIDKMVAAGTHSARSSRSAPTRSSTQRSRMTNSSTPSPTLRATAMTWSSTSYGGGRPNSFSRRWSPTN